MRTSGEGNVPSGRPRLANSLRFVSDLEPEECAKRGPAVIIVNVGETLT
jgi:hypothetical protein